VAEQRRYRLASALAKFGVPAEPVFTPEGAALRLKLD
jgi:hypothetical protein